MTEMKKVKEGEKKGEEYEANQTYYPSLASALNSLIQKRLKDSDATTLMELKNDLKVIKEELYAEFNENVDIDKIN